MRCDRCDQPVTPEESETVIVPGATGPGCTLRVHRRPCSPPPYRPRTYPTP